MSLAADASNDMTKMSEASGNEQSGNLKNYDADATNDKINKLWAEVVAKKEAAAKKEAELAAVPVEEADVAVVADSLNLPPADAKLLLQKKKGDVVAALREAVGLPKNKA